MAKSSTTTPRDRVENAVNTLSRPSDLKITDMRIAVVAANYDDPIRGVEYTQAWFLAPR